MVNDYSDEGKLHIVPYDTRYRPIAPPETGIFDEPTAMVCINVEWIGHLDGALERLLWRDAWDGDLTTQLRAVKEIRKLLSEIHRRLPCCDCEDDMNCEQMIECLQPLFDNLNTRLDTIETSIEALQEQVEAVQETQQNNTAKMPEPQISEVADEICGGSTALVDYLHKVNLDVYNDAEYGLVDEVYEAIPIFIDEFPLLAWLPFDELFDLVNAHFANQVVDYQDDYDLIKDFMICDLKCMVEANDGAFTFDLWASWLVLVGEKYAGNRAASVFSRYAPTSATFANQIAEFVSQEQSLQSFFNQLNAVYYAGLKTPTTCACDCAEFWCHDIDLAEPLPAILELFQGVQTAGGIQSTSEYVAEQSRYFERVLFNLEFDPPTTIISSRVVYDLEKGTFDENNPTVLNGIAIASGEGFADNWVSSAEEADGEDKTSQLTASVPDTEFISYHIIASRNPTAGGGSVLAKTLRVCGTGTEPDWSPA